jgi:hypothetical protein
LVNFVVIWKMLLVIWYILSRYGLVYREKSGSPGSDATTETEEMSKDRNEEDGFTAIRSSDREAHARQVCRNRKIGARDPGWP